MALWGGVKGREKGMGKPTPFMASSHGGGLWAELHMASAMAPSKKAMRMAMTSGHGSVHGSAPAAQKL